MVEMGLPFFQTCSSQHHFSWVKTPFIVHSLIVGDGEKRFEVMLLKIRVLFSGQCCMEMYFCVF